MMQIQRGLRKDASLTKFVLGAHPIIEHFINLLRIRETIGTHVLADKTLGLLPFFTALNCRVFVPQFSAQRASPMSAQANGLGTPMRWTESPSGGGPMYGFRVTEGRPVGAVDRDGSMSQGVALG